ncbi:hypothetical protein SRHO_G00230130 [Serrasalmus rhombeus]
MLNHVAFSGHVIYFPSIRAISTPLTPPKLVQKWVGSGCTGSKKTQPDRGRERNKERRGGRTSTRGGTQQGMKGDTPVNSTMSVGQARKLVEQLKIEASFCRIKVSKAAADLMAYCDAHACEDPLITPVPTSENPFREKKFFCALL